jgi:hypothetical protein
MRVSGARRGPIEAPDYIWYYIEAQAFIEGNGGGIGGGDMGTGDEAGAVWADLVEPFAERLVDGFDKEGCESRILVWSRDPECEELDAGRGGSDGAQLVIGGGWDVEGGRYEADEVSSVDGDEAGALGDDEQLEEELGRVADGEEDALGDV